MFVWFNILKRIAVAVIHDKDEQQILIGEAETRRNILNIKLIKVFLPKHKVYIVMLK